MLADVKVPIRLRLDPVSLQSRPDDIDDALAKALGRALANSREALTHDFGSGFRTMIRPATVTWRGPSLADIDEASRSRLEIRIARLIGDLADQASANGPQLAAGPGISQAAPAVTRDPFSRPSRQQLRVRRQAAAPAPPLDAKDLASRIQAPDAGDRGRAFLELYSRLLAGDESAFVVAMLGIRADGDSPTNAVLQALRELARRNPRRFRELLNFALSLGALTKLERDDVNIVVDKRLLPDLLNVAAGAVRAASEIPAGAEVLRQRERQTPGLRRLIGLIEALVAARAELAAYLLDSKEKTDPKVLAGFQALTADLPRVSGLFAAFPGDERLERLVYELQVDLLEHHRWIANSLEKIRAIDDVLSIYRLIFGDAADVQDEVVVLLEARGVYLKPLATDFLPNARRIEAWRTHADAFYADYTGKAADRKYERLKKQLADLPEFATHSAWYGGYRQRDHRFNPRSEETHAALTRLRRALETAGDKARDLAYLTHLEQEMPLQVTRLSLLSYWYAAIRLSNPISYPDEVGSSSARRDWFNRLFGMIDEIEKQYVSPDYPSLESKLKAWETELKSIENEIRSAAKREFWINLGINIAALLITARVSFGLSATRVSAVTVTLAEAATFTAVTTAGQSIVLGKRFDLGTAITGFVDNALLFGAFRVVGTAYLAGLQKLLPGRALTQLTIFFGTTTVVTTGAPLVISRLERGKWPDDMWTFVVSSLVMNAMVGIIAGPRLRQALEAQARLQQLSVLQELYPELVQLAEGHAQWLAAMERMNTGAYPTREQFAAAKALGASGYAELERLVSRMLSQLTDQTLADLGLTREGLTWLASEAGSYARQIAAAEYTQPLSRGLPAPTDVIQTGLVRTPGGTYEYNPNLPGLDPIALVLRFRALGYVVTDEGAGVLRLQPPGGGVPEYRLLPAGPNVAPPALSDLGGRVTQRGVAVVQQDPELVSLITTVQQLAGTALATRLLVSTGRFLQPGSSAEIAGMKTFLNVGGEPAVLVRLMSPAENVQGVLVRHALRVMQRFSADAASGLAVFYRTLPRATSEQTFGVFNNFTPEQVVGIFETLHALELRSEGLRRVLPSLYGNNPNAQKGAEGYLLTANRALAAYPDGILILEDPLVTSTGRVFRITDITVRRPGYASPLRIEVKVITSVRSLGATQVRQLADDIIEDFRVRQSLPVVPGGSRPYYETVRWEVHDFGAAADIAQRLGIDSASDPRVRAALRSEVQNRLRPVFTRFEARLKQVMPDSEFDGYRAAFEADLPFFRFPTGL